MHAPNRFNVLVGPVIMSSRKESCWNWKCYLVPSRFQLFRYVVWFKYFETSQKEVLEFWRVLHFCGFVHLSYSFYILKPLPWRTTRIECIIPVLGYDTSSLWNVSDHSTCWNGTHIPRGINWAAFIDYLEGHFSFVLSFIASRYRYSWELKIRRASLLIPCLM